MDKSTALYILFWLISAIPVSFFILPAFWEDAMDYLEKRKQNRKA